MKKVIVSFILLVTFACTLGISVAEGQSIASSSAAGTQVAGEAIKGTVGTWIAGAADKYAKSDFNIFSNLTGPAGKVTAGATQDILNAFKVDNVALGSSDEQVRGGPSVSGSASTNRGSNPNDTYFFKPTPGDVSITFLGYVFGNVGNVINGNGVPLLGKLLGIFNSALIGLGIIIITYLVAKGVLDTAAHGEFLGKQFNSVWVPVRVVVGILLLIPREGGYCIAQLLVMQIIVMGVGAADTVWITALNYFQNGGALSPVSATSVGPQKSCQNVFGGVSVCKNDIGATTAASAKAQMGQREEIGKTMVAIFQDLICSQAIAQTSNPPSNAAPVFKAPSGYYFPGGTDGCGTVTWTGTALFPSAVVQAGMQAAIANLNSQAALFVTMQQAKNSIGAANIITPTLFTNALNIYTGAVMNAASQKNPNNAFMETAKDRGWAYAGSYFHDLISLDNKQTDIPVPTATGPALTFPSDGIAQGYYNAATTAYNAMVAAQAAKAAAGSGGNDGEIFPANPGQNDINITPQIIKNCAKQFHTWTALPGECTGPGGKCTKDNVNTIRKKRFPGQCITIIGPPIQEAHNAISDEVYNKVRMAFNYLQANTAVQPLLAIQNVGQGLLHTIAQIMMSIVDINKKKTALTEKLALMSAGLSLLPIVGGSLSKLADAKLQANLSIMSSFQGFLIAVAGALMMPTAMLSVFIPMLPYMLFVIGVLGWVLTVFEAIVAAPIVGLGIIHPEGHDLYGKAQPAVMLLVNVFIKPMLMVIGLMAASLIASGAVLFINPSFHLFVKTTFTTPMLTNITDAAMFSLLILFMYMSILLAVINKCFQLIYIIPDKVLRWLDNFAPSGQDEGQMLQEVKGEYQQEAGAAKDVATKGMETSVAVNNAQNEATQSQMKAYAEGVKEIGAAAVKAGSGGAEGAPSGAGKSGGGGGSVPIV